MSNLTFIFCFSYFACACRLLL